MLFPQMRSKLFMRGYRQRDKNMKLIKDLQGRVMTTVFGGGCPICGSKNRLTNVGGVFKPCLECSACGSKFKQRSLGSPKYKLIEGSSDHLGKELTLKEWAKMTQDMRRETKVAEGEGETQEHIKADGTGETPKEPSKAENIVIGLFGIVFVIGAICALFSGRPGLAIVYWTFISGVPFAILLGIVKGIQWLKSNF